MKQPFGNSYQQEEEETRLIKVLKFVDIFSYVPVPQAYPISTSKSRFGSILAIIIILAYFGYDFYLFIAKNLPTINAYETSFFNEGQSQFPEIAFGFKYLSYNVTKQQQFVNSSQYIDFKFNLGYTESSLELLTINESNLVNVSVIDCSKGTRAFNISKQLKCLDLSTLKLQQNANSLLNQQNRILTGATKQGTKLEVLLQKLQIYLKPLLLSPSVNAVDENTTDVTEQQEVIQEQQIKFQNTKDFLERCQFIIYIFQPIGYNYAEGTQIKLDDITRNVPQNVDYYVTNINYFDLLYKIYFTRTTRFQISPNYFTTFTEASSNSTRVVSQEQQSYKQSPELLLATFIFRPDGVLNVVQLHYDTIIDKIEQWNSFLGFVILIGAIIFLGYNKNKFNEKYPDWERFDKVLHEKKIIQMTPQNINQGIMDTPYEQQNSEI